MRVCCRPFSGTPDLEQLRSLLIEARRRRGHSCWHVGDLVWRLFLHAIRFDLGQTLHLWEDADGTVLGFAIITPPGPGGTLYFDLQIHPRLCGQGLEEELLDWVESWHQANVTPRMPCCFSTDTGVYEDDIDQIEALEHRGFVRSSAEGLLLLRALDRPIATPFLPQGFAVRALAGPHEVEERTAAHRDAYSRSRITDEAYLRLMQMPGYLPELDLVAIAADGSFGAFCNGWLDQVNRTGEFEPVGTRPAFRRMGLARAVLLDGLRRMKTQGMESAVVGPIPADDDAALGLYRSIGFRPIRRLYAFTWHC
jgi:mycothiol synthase